jgi:hypothetical protein
MKNYLFPILFAAIGCMASYCECNTDDDEELSYFIKNNSISNISYRFFNTGNASDITLIAINTEEFVGGGGQLEVDSVRFVNDDKVISFVNPKYDFPTYEATKNKNFFNRENWIELSKNKFVYTLKEESFQ